ncbi:MAG: PilZ domain-containing protein [Polyangiales bacterium]
MLSTVDILKGDRKTLRRAVSLRCELDSDVFDEAVPFVLSDLSPLGAFVDTPLPLDVGDSVTVTFTPPHSTGTWCLRARVARVGLGRRASDLHPVGMGLEFLDLGPVERAELASCLAGLPPRIPPKVHATPARAMRARPSKPTAQETCWVDSLVSWEEDHGDYVCSYEMLEPVAIEVEAIEFESLAPMVTAPRPAYRFMA